jgi:hypothetical protein
VSEFLDILNAVRRNFDRNQDGRIRFVETGRAAGK